MEQRIRCIYRKKKCFHICNKTAIKNSFYCCYHIHSKKKHLCKIFHNVLEDSHDLTNADIYNIYEYILENTDECSGNDDIFINILFIDLLKMIPIGKLSNIYKDYLNNDTIATTTSAKSAKSAHSALYTKIYVLNKKTHDFNKICNTNALINLQNIVKYKLMCISDSLNTCYLNDEELFTTVSVADIHPRKLFTIKDIKGNVNSVNGARGAYAFDIVELEYFVRRCLADNVEPYNPYTRELLSEKVLWKMRMKIKYDGIIIKKEACVWTTEMNAYTDLSIEIERRGFYNNPEWFKKMTKSDLWKCIKLFSDFSRNIEEGSKYFLNISEDSFIYDFCKESIRMFRECNDDLYVLCCNYMKALALCSNDFYNNVPDWLSTFETTSHIASTGVAGINSVNSVNGATFPSFMSALISNNYGIGDLSNNIGGMDSTLLLNNTNLLNSVVNPSNNFLLYYYVEYM